MSHPFKRHVHRMQARGLRVGSFQCVCLWVCVFFVHGCMLSLMDESFVRVWDLSKDGSVRVGLFPSCLCHFFFLFFLVRIMKDQIAGEQASVLEKKERKVRHGITTA